MDDLRFLKVNSLIKQEISRIIENEISDPRVSALVTVQKIKSSKDFFTATDEELNSIKGIGPKTIEKIKISIEEALRE